MTLKRLAAALLVGAAMLLAACGGGGPGESGTAASECVAQPRFTDNDNGTVSDSQTGLMWEKKTGTIGPGVQCTNESDPVACADPNDVNNQYAWSANGTAPDGPLYSVFLAQLNGEVVANGDTACFAGHCDWRIPTDQELLSIVGSRCIDPIFVPTQAFNYWSSNSNGCISDLFAWRVDFSDMFNGCTDKSSAFHARAVRSGQ